LIDLRVVSWYIQLLILGGLGKLDRDLLHLLGWLESWLVMEVDTLGHSLFFHFGLPLINVEYGWSQDFSLGNHLSFLKFNLLPHF
jgi:hypothetical protein